MLKGSNLNLGRALTGDLGVVAQQLDKSKQYTEFSFASEMSPLCEAYLFQAARAQLWQEKIIPWLNQGMIVLVDRCGYSSDVYQGLVRGLGLDFIEQLNEISTQGYRPQLTILTTIDAEKGVEWILSNQRKKKDRIDSESLDFHKQVFEGYNKLPKLLPKRLASTFRVVDFGEYMNLDEEEAKRTRHERIMHYILEYINENRHLLRVG